jgi:hypothetical protein
MLTLEQTELETFSFGENPDDTYYILVNRKVNPVGVDLIKLSQADPRTLDATLNEMGCILMLSGDEVNELVRRGDADKDDLHRSLFSLARQEGIIK